MMFIKFKEHLKQATWNRVAAKYDSWIAAKDKLVGRNIGGQFLYAVLRLPFLLVVSLSLYVIVQCKDLVLLVYHLFIVSFEQTQEFKVDAVRDCRQRIY